VKGNTIGWAILDADLERITKTLIEFSTFITIDLDCNRYAGPDRRPISSSTTPLYGITEPLIPGGIMRLQILAAREDAPQTFLSRPFARTPSVPVAPGLDLSNLVRG
jgi:hypothetical protein